MTYEERIEKLNKIRNERYNRTGEMKYGSWQFESWGSCSCASSTMDSIYSAYEESKICNEW